jgi:hypothetical protein
MEIQVIKDDDYLWRRIDPKQRCKTKPPPAVGIRPSRENFKDFNMSVNVERLTTVEDTLQGHESYGIAKWSASHLRQMGFEVCHRPLHDNLAHAEVIGEKTRSTQLQLADSADFFHQSDEIRRQV